MVPSVVSLLASHTEMAAQLSGAPQVAAVVVDANGEIIAEFTTGEATVDSLFRIASMTKSFSAALVLLLRDEGVVNLDLPISTYAAEFETVIGLGPSPTPITLRHLLSMDSGLATDDPWADRHLDATDADLDGWVGAGLRFAHPTGTAFEYSNLGWALIGRVVHRVTGRRLQDLVTERLAKPLGMNSTMWVSADLSAESSVVAGWHRVNSQLVPEVPLGDGVIAPMGGLWSTARDLATWVGFLSNAFGASPANHPLSAASRREMQQIHRSYPGRSITGAEGRTRAVHGGYGFGLNVNHHDRTGWVVWHSGGLPGYGSTMRWIPGGGGVVMLANVTYAPVTAVGLDLIDALVHQGCLANRVVSANEALQHVAREFAQLLQSWTDTCADDLFADNVFRDRPRPIRKEDVVARVGASGNVRLLGVEAISATTGVALLLVENVVHRLELQLAPIGPPKVQAYRWLT